MECQFCKSSVQLDQDPTTGASVCRACVGKGAESALKGLGPLGTLAWQAQLCRSRPGHLAKISWVDVRGVLHTETAPALRVGFSAERKGWGVRIARWLGEKQVMDLQTGDADFDADVFVRTDTEEATAQWLEDPVVRASVGHLVQGGGTVRVDGSHLDIALLSSDFSTTTDPRGKEWIEESLWVVGVLFARLAARAGVSAASVPKTEPIQRSDLFCALRELLDGQVEGDECSVTVSGRAGSVSVSSEDSSVVVMVDLDPNIEGLIFTFAPMGDAELGESAVELVPTTWAETTEERREDTATKLAAIGPAAVEMLVAFMHRHRVRCTEVFDDMLQAELLDPIAVVDPNQLPALMMDLAVIATLFETDGPR